MRLKKLPSFLQKHCVTLLLCAIVLAVGFAFGWFAHVDQQKAAQVEAFSYDVTNAAQKIATVQRLYHTRARADELSDPISIDLDIIVMRRSIATAYNDMLTLEPRHLNPYPEARTYLQQLFNDLMAANYTDYHSLEPSFTAAWPLMDSAGHPTLPETMEALTERLATEEGQAAWDLLDPNGIWRQTIGQPE